MEYRDFGKTDLKVSIVGFGGIVALEHVQEDVNRMVASAIDRGVNYFDFAPGYGNAEELLGPALKGRRDGLVLACKTAQRDAEGARMELHRSLERLGTDHFDIYQFHGVPNMDELNTIFGPGGAIEAFLEAKEEGLVRYIGITTHTPQLALEAFRRADLDSVLFPINFIYWLNGGGSQVLEEAANRGIARAAIKSMAMQAWPEGCERKWNKTWYQPIDDPELARLAARFTLSQDVNVMIPPGHAELWEMAMSVAEDFTPITSEEMEYLKGVAAGHEPLFDSAA